MKNVGELLRDADPLAGEERMSADQANRMRRAIVDATRDATNEVPGWWPKPMVVAATVAVTLAAGVAVGRWLPPRDHEIGVARASAPPPGSALRERRQLHFATPGGTRIIWVFDPDFNP